MKTIKRILFGLGWLVAILALALRPPTAYRHSTPENPFPEEKVVAAVFHDCLMASSGTTQLSEHAISLLPLLFEGSRRDRRPLRWKVFGDLELTFSSGETRIIRFYSTDSPGAYSIDKVYYRAGTTEQFRRVLKQGVSNKAVHASAHRASSMRTP
jgi:hypothetical protein